MASDLRASVACAAVLGLASAFGDWLWAGFIPDGAVVPGVLHGLAIFALLAVVLAWAAGTRLALKRLLPTLPLARLGIAAVFYPLAALLGYLPALLVTWILMWLTLAVCSRWARQHSAPMARAVARGLLAALLSGLAFWSISGIWTAASAASPNYVIRALQWTYAYWPGFAALLLGQSSAPSGAAARRN